MKSLSKLAGTALLCAAAMATLTSCNSKEPEYVVLPENIAANQDLLVEQLWDGTINAFANFKAATADGTIVKCRLGSKSKITVNGKPMDYFFTETYNMTDYDYTLTLPQGTTVVTFALTRSTGVYTNRIDLASVPSVVLTENYDTLRNDTYYHFRLEGGMEGVSPRIYLLPKASFADVQEAILLNDSTFYFRRVPAGEYELRFLTSLKLNLQQQDNNAGGDIMAARYNRVTGVQFKANN